MKFVIDMNLSPRWVTYFNQNGWDAVHWSEVGNANDPDELIFDWAKKNSYIVFTHDLDFGAILAATKADAPSVVQVRTQDVLPNSLSVRLFKIIIQFESTLEKGALLTVDELKARIRVLPLN